MNWLTRLVRRPQLENQLDAELRDHFERLVVDHMRNGLAESDARRRARLDFGGMDQVKELCRDARGTRWLEVHGVIAELTCCLRKNHVVTHRDSRDAGHQCSRLQIVDCGDELRVVR